MASASVMSCPAVRPAAGRVPASRLAPNSERHHSVSFHRSHFLAGRQILSTVSVAHVSSQQNSRPFSLRVEAKGRKSSVPGVSGGQMRMEPKMPQFAEGDEAAYFAIFIRGTTVKEWYPLNIVSGGPVAKSMTQLMSSALGKKLYQSTLTRNIATALYKDADLMASQAKKVFPLLETQSSFEFGYKVVDKTNPKGSIAGTNVIKIPAESKMKSVLDRVKEFFSLESLTSAFGSSSSEEKAK